MFHQYIHPEILSASYLSSSEASTSFPPSPCTEYQYKNSSPSRHSLKIVSTYIFSPSRVISTSFILSFKNFTHSSTFSYLPLLILNMVNSTFNLLFFLFSIHIFLFFLLSILVIYLL